MRGFRPRGLQVPLAGKGHAAPVAHLRLQFTADRLLSIRGVDRTLRVAWTLCDLSGRNSLGLDEVSAALSFRQAGGAR